MHQDCRVEIYPTGGGTLTPSLDHRACLPANSQLHEVTGSGPCLPLSSGVADTELYDKVDYSKPETAGFSLFNKVWGQSPEKGAVSLTKTLSDPSMTGRGFACESSLLGFSCCRCACHAPCSNHLPARTCWPSLTCVHTCRCWATLQGRSGAPF